MSMRKVVILKFLITDLLELPGEIAEVYRAVTPQDKVCCCTGCFGCWVKTPGKCVIPDGGECVGVGLSHCNELLLISRCCYGSVSPFVKAVLDRAISYLHPDFVIRDGEMHHKRRYQNRLTVSAYFYGENITEAEKETARGLIAANAVNYDGTVGEIRFFESAEGLEKVIL